MSINDEEWAVISSGSDIEDEQSTTCSNGNEVEKEVVTQDDSIASIRTLKLPTVDSRSSGIKEVEGSSDSKANDINEVDEGSSVDTPDESSESDASEASSVPDESSPINTKIKFFENLSNINESIKQKSNDFYQNFTKIKLTQLSDYINEVKGEGIPETNEVEDVHINEDSDTLLNNLNDDSCSFCKLTFIKSLNFIQSILDEHSDYLYYYGIVISLFIASITYVSLQTPTSQPAPQPQTVWESIIYQDEKFTTTKYYFWKKIETVKTNRFAHYNDVIVKRVGTWLDNDVVLQSMNAWENLKLNSLIGLDSIKVYGFKGYNNMMVYSLKGYDGVIVYVLKSQDTITGTILPNIKHDLYQVGVATRQTFSGLNEINKSWLKSVGVFSKNMATNTQHVSKNIYHYFHQQIELGKIQSWFNSSIYSMNRGMSAINKSLFNSWNTINQIKWKNYFFAMDNQFKSSSNSLRKFVKNPIKVSKVKHDFDNVAVAIYLKMNGLWKLVTN